MTSNQRKFAQLGALALEASLNCEDGLGDVGGFDMQDWALQLGIIVPTPAKPGDEFDEYLRLTAGAKSMLAKLLVEVAK